VNPLPRAVASWAAPIVLTGAYVGLIATMRPSLTISLFVLLGLLCVLVLWFLFRELAAHAAITRAIAVGEPDDVVGRARDAIDHRFSERARRPFRIYEAVGLGLRGQWEDSVAALSAAGIPTAPAWKLLAASARIAAATELGNATAARVALADVTVASRRLGWRADVVARDCQARVRFAEGDRAGALELFRALAGDVRVGPAVRAAALYYAGRCQLDDDRVAAERDLAAAAKLAPRTWVKAAAEAALAGR
jgi:hypothetical protein